MSRKTRRRERAQGRPVATAARTGVIAPRGPSPRARGGLRTGTGRAVGEPSPTLERAAALERAFVTKDFRRIGVVVIVMLVLLALSGVGVSAFLK